MKNGRNDTQIFFRLKGLGQNDTKRLARTKKEGQNDIKKSLIKVKRKRAK